MDTDSIPVLTIGNLTLRYPIVQGGMGVKVSLATLASAVTNAGGLGTIASVGLDNLREVVRNAKRRAAGPIAVNVMCALSDYDDRVRDSVAGGADVIVSGAGLPLHLPELVGDAPTQLVPIVSSGRATTLILKTWHRRYQRTADAIVVEGPLAGGHLGFSAEVLTGDEPPPSLASLVREVVAATATYEARYDRPIPVIAAGGLFDGSDIAAMVAAGAAGVQLGTRFVATDECDVADAFKQAYIDAGPADIGIVHSPVGMPGRAILNAFIRGRETVAGRQKVRCPYHCLRSCQRDDAPYCIADALIAAASGNLTDGLVFCGANAHRVTEVVPVSTLMHELVTTTVESWHVRSPGTPLTA